jgi:hypothetical protein
MSEPLSSRGPGPLGRPSRARPGPESRSLWRPGVAAGTRLRDVSRRRRSPPRRRCRPGPPKAPPGFAKSGSSQGDAGPGALASPCGRRSFRPAPAGPGLLDTGPPRRGLRREGRTRRRRRSVGLPRRRFAHSTAPNPPARWARVEKARHIDNGRPAVDHPGTAEGTALVGSRRPGALSGSRLPRADAGCSG